MNNLDISATAQAEENRLKEAEKPEVEDLLGIADDIKHYIDNVHYQNSEIRGGSVFYIL